MAFQRGETDIYATSNLVALKELMADGFQPFVQKGRLLADGSSKKRSEFPKFRSSMSCWVRRNRRAFPGRLMLQLPTTTIPAAGGEETPPEIVKLYRDTMARIEKDKEFAAELAKVAGDAGHFLRHELKD